MGATVITVATVAIQAAATISISVFDGVGVVDAGQSASLSTPDDINISVSQDIGVADVGIVVTVGATTYSVSELETIGVDDVATVVFTAIADFEVNEYESVGIADVPTVEKESLPPITVSESEAIGVAENFDVTIDDAADISISEVETVGVSDVPTVSVIDATAISINEFEAIGIAEFVDVFSPEYNIVEYESIGVAEYINLLVEEIGAISLQPGEDLAITESVSASVSAASDINVSEVEAVGVADVPTVQVAEGGAVGINVFDGVSLSESLSASLSSVSDDSVSEIENIGVADVATVNVGVIELYTVNEGEDIIVSEYSSVVLELLHVNVNDAISISEYRSASISGDLNPSETETITVSESASVTVEAASDIDIDESEIITVSEYATRNFVSPDLDISEFESITVAESVSRMFPDPSKFETLDLVSEIGSSISLASEIGSTISLISEVPTIGLKELLTYTVDSTGDSYMSLPVPNPTNFSLAFKLWVPISSITTGYRMLLDLGHTTGNAFIGLDLGRSMIDQSCRLYCYGYTDQNTWVESVPAYAPIADPGWWYVQLSRSGSSVYCTVSYPGYSSLMMTLNLGADTLTFDHATLFAGRSANYWGAGTTYKAPVWEGTKVKEISGNYVFGTAYTDIAQTSVCEPYEYIASIINTGTLGGNMTQSTLENRPIAGLLTGTYIHELTLDSRII